MPHVIHSAEELHRLTRLVFESAGASLREADLIADHLVEANLRGHDSHGVGMIPTYINNWRAGGLIFNQALSIELESGALLVCDGLMGPGQVMPHDALETAIALAQVEGCCVLALRNSHHMGRIGHWAEQCAAAGLVSVHFVNVVSEPEVVPFGGAIARLGTNPFSVGIPRSNSEPIVVDFATSKWAAGKVRVAQNRGQKVPADTLVDADGRPTDDPNVLFSEPKGALLPFGGHKGWGLALACELLGAALTGGKTQAGPKSRQAIVNSMCSILISPDHLGTRDSFRAQTETSLKWVLSERGASILLAGDPERHTKHLRQREGVPIDSVSWSEIIAAGASVGVKQFQD